MSEPQRDLSAIHAVLSGYLMHWHRLAVDSSLFIATGSLTVAGFTLSASTLDLRRAVVAIGLLVIIAAGGAFISRVVLSHVRVLRGMIEKIDEENGVFEPGYLKSGLPLYPPQWKAQKVEDWNDPIATLTTFASLVLPLTLAVIIAACVLLFPGAGQ
jgi:hypothetical protein